MLPGFNQIQTRDLNAADPELNPDSKPLAESVDYR